MAVAVLIFCSGCSSQDAAPQVSTASSPPTRSSSTLDFTDYNLVFVSFDALQGAHVGSLGYPRQVTPTLDALAEQGYSFTHTYSVASWTVPASMTWFTGVYPSEHRMTNKFSVYNSDLKKPANLRELSPQLVTLAEVLKRDGYATGGFTGNAGVSGGFGYEQGFDVYYYEPGKFGGFDQSIPRALEWVREHREQKFFLFLHGYDCHGQNTPHEGFDYRFVDPGYDQRFTGSELEQETLREEGLENGQLQLRDSDVQFWRAVYDEKINRADAQFHEFLNEFTTLGLNEKTIFIVTSDHGTELLEHGRLDHGFTLYEELLHVPLIVKLPGQTAPQQITDRVSSIDVMPTVLDLLKVETPEVRRQLRGVSLVPAMLGEPVARNCYAETDYREYTFKRALISPEGWKLILTLESNRRELFNLTQDPHEIRNLAAGEPRIVNKLETQLRAHFKTIGSDLSSRRWETGLNPVYPSQAQPKK